MKFEDEPAFKLAPARTNFITANIKAEQNDQRTLLNKDNILRAKQLTNTNYSKGEVQSAMHAVKPKVNKNIKAKDEKANMKLMKAVRTNELEFGLNIEEYQNVLNANPINKLFEIEFIQEINNTKGAASNRNTAVSFKEKAANAADYNLVLPKLKVSLDYKTNNHLDGPVPSNDTTEEEHAGQMTNCIDASSGFECDGNRFTSFTKNSTE